MRNCFIKKEFCVVHFSSQSVLKNIVILFSITFATRFVVFYTYIQHNERYCQADSMDYHNSALGISFGTGMHRPDNNKPIFWRTPGYPLYISLFYNMYGLRNGSFSANMPAQKACLYFQIFLSSFIPILVLLLSLLLTQSVPISWIVAIIFALHPGFVLASCYLLTEALAMIFFLIFLIFFCKNLLPQKNRIKSDKNILIFTAFAALNLALYTWMRPHGQFVAIVSLLLMLLASTAWVVKSKQLIIFSIIFFGLISGWCVRNYSLTGEWFFCPMSGPYLVSFCAPKIVRRIIQKPLELCIKLLHVQVQEMVKKREAIEASCARKKVVCQELVCSHIAWPWLYAYPYHFLYDWIKETIKTSFDLYASQLVAFANNSYKYDPLEEFLSEKLALCLYKQPMPYLMRIICWLELVYMIFLWIGIAIGSVVFLLKPLWLSLYKGRKLDPLVIFWLKIWFFVGSFIFMTGGFGYARLRIPIEPFLVIFSLKAWSWIIYYSKKNIRNNDELSLCAVA